MTQPPQPVSISLLGGTEIRGPLPEASRLTVQSKIVALLALLSVPTVGRYLRRNWIVGMLWPDTGQEQARTSLRKALHFTRAALGPDTILTRGDEEVALSATTVWCDAAAFTAAAEAGFLMQALQLYSGELLSGFHVEGCVEFDQWLEEQRFAARERAAAAAWAMAQRFETSQHLSDAAGMARRAMRYSWSDERALRRALVMLERLGDRAGAIRLYEEFVKRLRADLDMDPSPETRELAERIRIGGVTGGA